MSIGREGIHDVKKATASWYSNGNYEKLISDYPVKEYIDGEILNRHNKYCRNADIHYTPTILINGRIVPEEYSPEDIKYLV